MRVGYVRVSTVGQNTARQEVLMEELGAERVYIDRMSGKNTSRPALRQMLEFVREGDVVVVESISRFARNTRDLLELVEQLSAKGVDFVSKKEAIDTMTPSGRLGMNAFLISFPRSVRIGIFWRFGFDELSLPVAVSA